MTNAKSDDLSARALIPLDRGETIALDQADWEVFSDALANPPEPSSALKKAVKIYRKQSTSE